LSLKSGGLFLTGGKMSLEKLRRGRGSTNKEKMGSHGGLKKTADATKIF